MKRPLTILAVVTATAAVPIGAAAQTINERQSFILSRIDQGVRSGAIDRYEADRLTAEMNALVRLETDYRRGGFTQWERQDLQRRLDDLSRRVRFERGDSDRYVPQFARLRDRIEQQIRAGARGGGLTDREAALLRNELNALVRLEERHMRSGRGLEAWERQELSRGYQRLEGRVYAERRDNEQRRYGYGYGYPDYGYPGYDRPGYGSPGYGYPGYGYPGWDFGGVFF